MADQSFPSLESARAAAFVDARISNKRYLLASAAPDRFTPGHSFLNEFYHSDAGGVVCIQYHNTGHTFLNGATVGPHLHIRPARLERGAYVADDHSTAHAGRDHYFYIDAPHARFNPEEIANNRVKLDQHSRHSTQY